MFAILVVRGAQVALVLFNSKMSQFVVAKEVAHRTVKHEVWIGVVGATPLVRIIAVGPSVPRREEGWVSVLDGSRALHDSEAK